MTVYIERDFVKKALPVFRRAIRLRNPEAQAGLDLANNVLERLKPMNERDSVLRDDIYGRVKSDMRSNFAFAQRKLLVGQQVEHALAYVRLLDWQMKYTGRAQGTYIPTPEQSQQAAEKLIDLRPVKVRRKSMQEEVGMKIAAE